jgi:hypothetical protein
MAVGARIDERMMPAAMLPVIVLHVAGVEQLAYVVRLPFSGRPIKQITQQFPITAVIEAQHALRLPCELIERREQRHTESANSARRAVQEPPNQL